MKNLNVMFYLIVALGLLTALSTGVALDLITSQMRAEFAHAKIAGDRAILSETLARDVTQSSHFDSLWAFSGQRSFLKTRDRWRERVSGALTALQDRESDPADSRLLQNATRSIHGLFALQDRSERFGPVKPGVREIQGRGMRLERTLVPVRAYLTAKLLKLNAIEGRVQGYEKISNRIAWGAEAGAVIFFLLMIWVLRVALLKPLGYLLSTMLAYREGHRSARVDTRIVSFQVAQAAGQAFNSLADSVADIDARKMEYLMGVAHDIRNPLTAMKTAVALFQRVEVKADPKKSQELLGIVADQIDRLEQMLTDWLDIERISQGRLELRRSSFDVRDIANDSIRLWKATSKGHWISFFAPSSPVMIESDPARLGQVLNNLLSNAIKYSPNGGEIDIKLLKEGEKISLSVLDHGIGIAPEELAHVFEPFRRSIAVRDFIPGVGLGLSTSRKIIESLGGTIEVESRLGMGSLFTIRLPLRLPLRLSGAPAASPPQAA